MIEDVLLTSYGLLFLFTISVLLVYYRRIREASREHSEAKAALDQMVFGFTRDLQKQEAKIQELAQRDDRASTDGVRMIEATASEIAVIKARLDGLEKARDGFLGDYGAIRKDVDSLIAQRDEILSRITELEATGKAERDESTLPVEPAIPIRREKAIAPLTGTEMQILQLLIAEGEKTAPEIREKTGLTREHTARLMKKLYASGYVERRTDRMPYAYRLKKEMEDLLKSRGTAA